MSKIVKQIGLAIAGLLVLFSFYLLWKQAQPEPIIYELFTPQHRTVIKKAVATGTLEARTQVELKPQITGIVSSLRVEPGQTVQTGDVVAVIKVIPDMSALSNAQSAVETARINLEQVEREANRSSSLYDDGVVSREDNEQMQSRLATAKAELASAQNMVEVVARGSSSRSGSINTTVVVSTMTGTVLSTPIKEGTSVSGSSQFSDGTTIAKVADMTDIIFRGNVDETVVARLRVGMAMEIIPGSMQEIRIPAKLEYISPESILQNGAKVFEIKASTVIPENVVIRSGYSANAEIILARADNVLALDESAIEFEGNDAFVYKLTSGKDEFKRQTFERIPVALGISDGFFVEIKDGIDGNMMIRGLQKKN